MKPIRVFFKKLNELAQTPVRGSSDSAGFDLVCTSRNETDFYTEYGTGLAFDIPAGYVGLIFPRSSITNKSQMLKNSVGVIDSDYRGEVKFRFQEITDFTTPNSKYSIGDKIGQIIFMKLPEVEMIESEWLSETVRGEGGFGSTGK